MNVRCPFCRNSFNLSRDVVAQAVAEADEKKQKHYVNNGVVIKKMIGLLKNYKLMLYKYKHY